MSMKWKLVHACFDELYFPKIKSWDNDLFVREGRTKVTVFEPIKGSVIVCPKHRYEKAYGKDVTDVKVFKWWKKYFKERRKHAKEDPTNSYWSRWTSTNAKNIYKYITEELRAD